MVEPKICRPCRAPGIRKRIGPTSDYVEPQGERRALVQWLAGPNVRVYFIGTLGGVGGEVQGTIAPYVGLLPLIWALFGVSRPQAPLPTGIKTRFIKSSRSLRAKNRFPELPEYFLLGLYRRSLLRAWVLLTKGGLPERHRGKSGEVGLRVYPKCLGARVY